MAECPKILALINAEAGTAERLNEDELKTRTIAAFQEHAVLAEVEVVHPGLLHERAEQALARANKGEIDAIVAGGGDGSIRTIAEVLAGSGVPLGVLPLGTCNHFAQDLHVPCDLDEAIKVICQGRTAKVDLAEVNGRVFLNNSSVGLYPYMVLDRERRRRKTGLNKWLAMAMALLRGLRHLPIRRMRIKAGGVTETSQTPCLFVGNNPYGLGTPTPSRRDRLDSGVLWLCVAKKTTPLALVWLGIKSFLGWLQPGRELRAFQTATADVATRTSRLFVSFDGEVEIMRPPLRYRIRPKDLLVYAPAAA